MSDLTFHQQLWVTALDKGLVGLGLATVGLIVTRAVERFKREQDVLSDVRKKQYAALSRMVEAVGQFERLTLRFDETVRKDWNKAVAEARDKGDQAIGVILECAYSVGPDVANLSLGVVKLIQRRMDRLLMGEPLEPYVDFQRKLNDLRRPLMRFMPRVQTQVPWWRPWRRRALRRAATAVLEEVGVWSSKGPPPAQAAVADSEGPGNRR